ncbi:hypothetical protein C7453_1098 [Gluconacetobacter liquefaciens]|uniref:Uncharacterized protein n=1 Tax=Gluconacetobacter liquefaciens TaxID=89584 RepID=A0A370G368_GLULI|nr:hypothetical protein C7453_1098 [Gluconacetobacter liquefaciens]
MHTANNVTNNLRKNVTASLFLQTKVAFSIKLSGGQSNQPDAIRSVSREVSHFTLVAIHGSTQYMTTVLAV